MRDTLSFCSVETGEAPTASVIWMHGLGADGYDFEPIVAGMDLSTCPAIRFIFPHAPSVAVTINHGYVMPAWYDIKGLGLDALQDKTGIEQSAKAIEQLIAAEMSKGISSEKIVLAGFSQGSAMALFTALRYPKKLAGIVALSGYLPLADQVDIERESINQTTPIFMGHGRQDNVVPYALGEMSKDRLLGWHYPVSWHSYSMLHSVHPQEIIDIAQFLCRVLA